MEMLRNDGWISLNTTDTLLRYKSEWDPRMHARTNGGYIDGTIGVPKVEESNEKLVCINCQISGPSARDIVHDPGDFPC